MRLEPVRTVLKNEVNEIAVCVDLGRRTGVFYTMISITEPRVRAGGGRAAGAGPLLPDERLPRLLFPGGPAEPRVPLPGREPARAAGAVLRHELRPPQTDRAKPRGRAGGVAGDRVRRLLLLSQRNLNIAPDLTVYLNYFLDFQKWDPDTEDSQFYRYAAQAVFQILSQEYELRSEGQFDSYPSELQAFYKKAETKGFLSHSAILAALKAMPDRPIELRVGVRRLAGRAGDLLEWVKSRSMAIFVAALVLATVIYAGYQITLRLSYRSAAEKNTAYAGLSNIGDVALGDETI